MFMLPEVKRGDKEFVLLITNKGHVMGQALVQR